MDENPVPPRQRKPSARDALAPLPTITLVDQVVTAIIKAAADGILRPGERIIEADLARRLQVSRVPVREALRQLESKGIVENTPYAGMRLMKVNERRIADTLKVRFALEREAVEQLLEADAVEPVDFSLFEAIIEDMRVASSYKDGYRLALADTAFHRLLCSIAGNEVLANTWEPLAQQMTIIIGISAMEIDQDGIVAEHVQLLEALRTRDPVKIAPVLREHIFAFLDVTIPMINQKSADSGAHRPD